MWNTSMWDYKKGGFRQLINTISDKTVLIPEALANFREVDQLPRKFKQMRVQEVSTNPNLILELWGSRTNMPAEKEYRLGCKKAFREKEIIDSLAETYSIDKKFAKCKVVLGRYSDAERTYCYALEIVIAPRIDLGMNHAGQIEIVDSVNSNASSDGGGSYFSGGNYRWEGRKRDRFTGDRERLYAASIRGILSECGFIMSGSYSKRRKPCVVFINLRCRCIEWLGAKGKTQINTDPFADEIAKTVSKLAYQMPSYHGEGNVSSVYHDHSTTYRDPNQVARDWLREFLKDRYEKVTADPSLKTRDRLTQSGVFYRIRRLMKNAEPPFEPPKDWETTRRGLTDSIRV